jgi:Uma2 family endonuclease
VSARRLAQERTDSRQYAERMTNLAERRHRWTRSEYATIADPGLRCELIEGEIVDVNPMSNRHRLAVDALRAVLEASIVGLDLCAGTQTPIAIDDHSEPEPDAWVARGSHRSYRGRDVLASDLVLVVEVADSSLRFDRTVKLPMYAAARVPEVWIIDVGAETLEVHRRPSGGPYEQSQTVPGDGTVVPSWGGELVVDHMLHGAP